MQPSTILRLTVSIALTCLFFAPAAYANQFANPGFETGDFSGWTVGGNSITPAVLPDGTFIPGTFWSSDFYQDVRTGDFAASAVVADLQGRRLFLAQTVSVLPSTRYIVGYWAGFENAGFPGPSELGFQRQPGSNEILVDSNPLYVSGPVRLYRSEFRRVFATFTTGPSQTQATISFWITFSGGLAAISLDDFHLNEIPAAPALGPAGIATLLVTLGAVVAAPRALAMRRRAAVATR